MKLSRTKDFIIIISLVTLCKADLTDDEDEDILHDLSKLYEEPNYELDPHDMLTPRRQNIKKTEQHNHADTPSPSLSNDCVLNEHCEKLLAELKIKLKKEKENYKIILNKFENEGRVDIDSYYIRMVKHLWTSMDMEKIGRELQRDDEVLTQHLTVELSLADIKIFQNYLERKSNLHQIDEFLETAFELDYSTNEPDILSKISFYFQSLRGNVKSVDTWLQLLCLIFICLGFWATYLFIKDIHRQLRWSRVIVMMCILIFCISCLWHWRHMHKVAESKKHAKMMKRGFTDLPEECKPGHGLNENWFTWASRQVFGGKDACEAYYEDMMVTTEEEITPLMVIAETLAKFLLQPLQLLGTESAKFISNFYSNVPIVYQVPATLLFIIIFILVLFVTFGYGIDFPLWLGGIRPMPAIQTKNDVNNEELFKEIKEQQEAFMKKSTSLLTDIAHTCMNHNSNKALSEPIMETSIQVIRSQLTDLISQQLSPLSPQKQNCHDDIDCSFSSKQATPLFHTPIKKPMKMIKALNESSSSDSLALNRTNDKWNNDWDFEQDMCDLSYSDLGSVGKAKKYVHNEEFVSQLSNVLDSSLDGSLNTSKPHLDDNLRHLPRKCRTDNNYIDCSPKGKRFLQEVNSVLQS